MLSFILGSIIILVITYQIGYYRAEQITEEVKQNYLEEREVHDKQFHHAPQTVLTVAPEGKSTELK